MSVSFESAPPASFASPIAAIDNPWLAPAAVTAQPQPSPTPRYMNNVPIIAPPSPKPSNVSTTGPSSRTAAMLWAVRRRNALVPLELLPPVPRNALVTSVTMVHIQHSRSSSGDGKDFNAKDNGIVLIDPFASPTEDKTSNTVNSNTNTNPHSSGEQTPTSPASPPTTPTRASTSPTSPTSQQVSFFFSPVPNKRPRLGRRRSSCTQTQQRSPPLSPSACLTTQSCATTARNVTYYPRVSLAQVTSVNSNNAGVETPQETKAESEREPKQDSKMIIDTLPPSITDTTTPTKESPLTEIEDKELPAPPPSYTASLMASDPRREQRSKFVVTVRIPDSSSQEEQPPSYVSSYFSGTAKASTDPLQAARRLKQDQLENEEALVQNQSSSPSSSSSPSAPWFVSSNALSPPPPPSRLKHRPLPLPLSLRKPRFLSLQARQAPLPPLPNNPYAYPAHVRTRAEGDQALPPSEILRLKRPFNVLPPGITIHHQQQRVVPAPPRLPAPKPAWNKPLVSSNLATCAPIVPTYAMEVEEDDEDLSMEMALSGGLEDGVYIPGTLLPAFPGSPANPALLYTSNRLPSRSSSLSRSSTQIATSPSPAPVRPRQKKGKSGKTGSRVAMLRWAILNHSGPEIGRRILGMGVRLAQEIWEAEQIMDEEDNRISNTTVSQREPELQLSNVRFRSRRRVSLPDEDQEEEKIQKEDDVMDVKEEQSFLLTTTTTEEHPMEDVPAATADNNDSKVVADDDMDMEGRDAIVPLSEHVPVLRGVPKVQEPHHHSAAPPPTAAPVEEKEMMATAIPEYYQDGLMSYEERARLADECIRELEEQMEIDDDTLETPPPPPRTLVVDVVNEEDEDVDMLDATAIPDAPITPTGVHPPHIEVERDPPLPETNNPEATVMDPEPAAQQMQGEENEPLLPVVPTSDTLSPSSLDFIASLPIPLDRDLFGPDLPMDLDPDPLRRHPLSDSSRIRLRLDYNGGSSPSSSLPRKRNSRLSHLATISSSMASFSITKRWFERMYL